MTVIEALHWCEDFQTNIITKVDRLLEKHRFALDATSIAKSAILCRIPVEPSMHKVDCDFIQIGNARWCKGTTVYKCPCCDSFVSRIHKFCFNCGQALDWGTADEKPL